MKRLLLSLLILAVPYSIFAKEEARNSLPEDIITKDNLITCNYNESNVDTVIKFENAVLNAILNKGSLDEVKKYLGTTYKQHYPSAEDGVDGLLIYLKSLQSKHVFSRIETKKVFGCGDYVIIENIFYSSDKDSGTAAINTFKVQDGKIVEHWELMEAIPTTSNNNNGIF